MKNQSLLITLLLMLYGVPAGYAKTSADNDYIFDPSLIRAALPGQLNIQDGTGDPYFQSGEYDVDLYLNGKFQSNTPLKLQRENGKFTLCLPPRFYRAFAVRERYLSDLPAEGCTHPERFLPAASVRVDTGKLRVDITIPQAMLVTQPAGYIAPDNLSEGSTMAFVNYNVNQFYSDYKNGQRFESTWLGINGGMNIGMWRFRQQGNFTHNEYGNRWQNTRSWVQRALPSVKSEVSVGELFSAGDLFNAVSFRGLNLNSDDRMLADSLRGYAPEIRGVANSNARVSVWQGRQRIYQTTVPPGPFLINDLSPVSYGGDLSVEVLESDGSRHRYTVPFAVLPESLRPGRTDYSFSAGKVTDYRKDNNFTELTVKRGLTNAITINGGMRLGNDYRSLLAGGVWASEMGAVGFNSAYSSADLNEGNTAQGWRYELNYSRTFEPTHTTLTFAGYQYSTHGYRDLNDVIALNNNATPGQDNTRSEYMQRNRLQMTINQTLGDWGSIYLSGSRQNYYDGRSRDTQYQAGYSTVMPGNISMNLSLSRQYTVRSHSHDAFRRFAAPTRRNEYFKDTQLQISFSMPLGSATNSPYLTLGGTHDSSSGSSYNASLSGVAGEDQTGYSLNVNRDQRQRDTTFSGSVNRKMSLASLTATASTSSRFNQMSVNAIGAAVLHSGGLTLGNYVSDTFALIEAKGAQGARVISSPGIHVDGSGYALVPSLIPYHYNAIALDASGSDSQVEVQNSEKTIAPYAGAMVRVKFQTLRGYPVMMKTTTNQNISVPMGADIINEQRKTIGTFGQAGNAYLRLSETQGTLKAVWGAGKNDSCTINYHIPTPKPDAVITYANAVCRF